MSFYGEIVVLAIGLFSMSGLPPLAGFFAKLLIFDSLIQSNYLFYSLILVLCNVIGTYYYLRIIKILFSDKPILNENTEYRDKPFNILSDRLSISIAIFLIIINCTFLYF